MENQTTCKDVVGIQWDNEGKKSWRFLEGLDMGRGGVRRLEPLGVRGQTALLPPLHLTYLPYQSSSVSPAALRPLASCTPAD